MFHLVLPFITLLQTCYNLVSIGVEKVNLLTSHKNTTLQTYTHTYIHTDRNSHLVDVYPSIVRRYNPSIFSGTENNCTGNKLSSCQNNMALSSLRENVIFTKILYLSKFIPTIDGPYINVKRDNWCQGVWH